ncbi:Calcium-binding EF-hand [Cynara cardunculus var. scolymus]|uniref:Calcium-binding EF-hand n=1 Tax=Cynara cardunculus var. scolymus TaxID=59895 RepID=A0A103XEB5_CYNCS|nr:Calcium-binding EF-hand [Cynara cardunculus var. scolymus]
MAAATDLRSPLLPSSNGSHRLQPTAVDARPSQVILTVNDGYSQSGTPTNQDSIRTATMMDMEDEFIIRRQENPYGVIGSDGFEAPGSTTVDPFRNQTPKIEGVYEWVKMLVILPIALVRLVLFGFYHWINRKGKPAPRDVAPILVSNHVSYIDPIFFFYELSPTIVASESHDSMPFVGTIIRAMQVIYVNRFSHQSRKHAVNEIKRKASSNRFPRVLLFPEGTTTNGRQLISFQLGAFLPGYPIQPVVIRYPHVEYLPVMAPSQHHKESAARFAERTGRAMASALNVKSLSPFMVEMTKIQKIFGFIDVDKNGVITFKEFLVGSAHILKLPVFRRACEMAFTQSDENKDHYISIQEMHTLFNLFDTDGDGKISKDDFMTCLRRNPLLIALFLHHFIDKDLTAETGSDEIV